MGSLPRTVAVVEDDPSVRRSIERLLNAHGHQTYGYVSAETFLESDFAGTIDCLVLDIHLGDMSGIQLQRRLRDSSFVLPVIFVTAYIGAYKEVDLLNAGANAVLAKPVEFTKLSLALTNLYLDRITARRSP